MRALASSAMLFSAAAVVLLIIVCANVSGLFLARAAGRQREFATRLALGASRSRLIRHSLVEALLTTLLGGALGLVWARGLAHVLGRMVPAAPAAPEVDIRTFAFMWLLMLATTAIVGLVPALHVARGSTLGSLKNRAAATSGWRHLSWQHGLVVAQLALCLAALVVAGLCLRSGARLAAVDTGIDDSNVALATFDASAAGYSRTSGVLFYEALRERVAALPGVASASLTHLVPFEGRSDSRTLGVPGYVAGAWRGHERLPELGGTGLFRNGRRASASGPGVSVHGSRRNARSRRGQRDAGASFLAGAGSRRQEPFVRRARQTSRSSVS